jgi:AraC family transcriptional regulator of adaptative response/methylated-DNA-[protein]-cysteine methyltransferase
VTRAARNSLQFAWIDSPVGVLRVGVTDTALSMLEFVNGVPAAGDLPAASKHERPADDPDQHGAPSPILRRSPILDQTRRELEEYFAGIRRSFEVPLSFHGSPFQERVWNVLRGIGYGEQLSYLEQSRRVGDEKAIRAVAQANGQNPIAILIPCHRVINANGRLGGFGGGLLRKQYLLDLERGDRLL